MQGFWQILELQRMVELVLYKSGRGKNKFYMTDGYWLMKLKFQG